MKGEESHPSHTGGSKAESGVVEGSTKGSTGPTLYFLSSKIKREEATLATLREAGLP